MARLVIALLLIVFVSSCKSTSHSPAKAPHDSPYSGIGDGPYLVGTLKGLRPTISAFNRFLNSNHASGYDFVAIYKLPGGMDLHAFQQVPSQEVAIFKWSGRPAKESPPKVDYMNFILGQRGEKAAKKLDNTELLNFNFRDADIKDVLDMIARVSGKNIIVSPEVKGKVNVRFSNKSWKVVLETVVKTLGYEVTYPEDGTVRVGPPKWPDAN